MPGFDLHTHSTFSDGTLDPDFGTGGVVLDEATDETRGWGAVAVQPDGRIVVAGGTVAASHAAFVVEHIRAAIEAQPSLAGRLALWGRRLMGEALTQAQRVAAEREWAAPAMPDSPPALPEKK